MHKSILDENGKRIPTENISGNYAGQCFIHEDKIIGWFNDDGIIKIRVSNYKMMRRDGVNT